MKILYLSLKYILIPFSIIRNYFYVIDSFAILSRINFALLHIFKISINYVHYIFKDIHKYVIFSNNIFSIYLKFYKKL